MRGQNNIVIEGPAFNDSSVKEFDWDTYAGCLVKVPDHLSQYGNSLMQITASKENTPSAAYAAVKSIKEGRRVLVHGSLSTYKDKKSGGFVTRILVESCTLLDKVDDQPETAGPDSLMSEERESKKAQAQEDAEFASTKS